MDLTTIERVKQQLKRTDSADDDVLRYVVSAASAAVEAFLGRAVERIARTEDYAIRGGFMRVLSLRAWPVTSVSEIRYDLTREFGSSSIIAATDYDVDLDIGLVSFDDPLIAHKRNAPAVVRVTYTGGMASTVDALPADVVQATTTHAVHIFQRRSSPHATGYSDAAGGRQYEQSMAMIPMVRELLETHRAR